MKLKDSICSSSDEHLTHFPTRHHGTILCFLVLGYSASYTRFCGLNSQTNIIKYKCDIYLGQFLFLSTYLKQVIKVHDIQSLRSVH